VYEGVILEDYVFCGPSMVFTNIVNPRSQYPQRGTEYYEKTLVKKGASLGANCTVICGNTIGQYGFVGAGAVVTRPVPDYALVMGNPAVVRGFRCECGDPLDFSLEPGTQVTRCHRCGRRFRREGLIITETAK
jgi:UDP-2-acetamido-3-amino-2,3-dideoxy-glucuronate N-acetyltransferase